MSILEKVLVESSKTDVNQQETIDASSSISIVEQCLGAAYKNTQEYVQVRNSVTKNFMTQGNLDASILYTRPFACLSTNERKEWTQCLDLGRSLKVSSGANITTDDVMEYMYPSDDRLADILEKYLEGEKTLDASFIEDANTGVVAGGYKIR
ncbi:hypothetical protein GNI_069350 [Gregarina niphandrodes]|uniref:Uncharacterized protein n=1 Tax=Gregarina niphandrodes TaxID=110365 RepID=A0A023B7H0_GRENI|nr:hypothetical protein GNI_069350 [Gregarina niphandrodes]EZG67340.1 hypothetical protein GNI_069350 [Gregarina niphandrodes]|eukprot:XP_011130266.1 hypothetical protein GNI_069350 [Gregarina niphandrodes]